MTCAATTVMAGAAVATAALTAYSTISSAQQRSGNAGYDQQVAMVNAQEAQAAAASDADAIRRKGQLANASAAADAAAAGLIPSEGSPYDVMLGNAQQTELAAQRRLFQGKLQASGDYQAAAQYGSQTNPNGGYLTAGAQLFGSGIKAYQLLNGPSPSTTTYTGPIDGSAASTAISNGIV